ncbi:plasmid recombination protein [Vreelandella jeotgali]|uniref:plasmid recombination protein n=1 Tax=Vreelandella jeotgali TaxID=553386 RepID=UPI00034BC398|nr:plasmid recombination protein [Halomonas jeotgali]
MAKPTYQFMRIQGFPRGQKVKRGTLGSILAEGLREPTHISHLDQSPNIRVDRLDSPVDKPKELQQWIVKEMEEAKNYHLRGSKPVYRSLRKDALAIGTVIVSHAKKTTDCPQQELDQFIEDTTKWVRQLMSDFEMIPHFRLTHLDEKYPHLHFWFTPKPNGEREGNWALTNLCCQRKLFYHKLQQRFFDDVGHKYFDERAKPMSERSPRVSRYIAVQHRKEQMQQPEPQKEYVRPASAKSVSDLIEQLGDKVAGDNLGMRKTVLSSKAQSLIQSLGMAPNVLPDPNEQESAAAAEREKQEALSGELSELKGRLSAAENQASSAPPDITPWLQELLFPIILNVAFQQGSRADHLGEEQWLTLVVEESGAMLEDKLNSIGLSREGIGGQISDAVSDSGFVENILAARSRSQEQTRERLAPQPQPPEPR